MHLKINTHSYPSGTGKYRWGFNGMEKDDNLKGSGNSYDFGARIQDPRLGRWLAVDSQVDKYVSFSPYNYSANNPILFIDPDGNKIFIYYETGEKDKNGKPILASYEYNSGLKKPNNRFVRKTVRTLNRIHKKGLDEKGIIKSLANDEVNHVNINEKKSLYSTAFIIETTGGTITEDGETRKLDQGEAPSNIYWNPKEGLVSPDGKETQSSANALLHELGHQYYSINDPEGFQKTVDMILRIAENPEEARRLLEGLYKSIESYDDPADKWLIENVETKFKGEWKRKNHGEGFILKSRGGVFSNRGQKYGKYGKEIGKRKDLKKQSK